MSFSYKPDWNAPITTHHPHYQSHYPSNYPWTRPEHHYIHVNFQSSLDSEDDSCWGIETSVTANSPPWDSFHSIMIMYTLGLLFSNKLLQAAGICRLIASVANVQEIDILLRSDAKDIISWHTVPTIQKGAYLFHNPSINFHLTLWKPVSKNPSADLNVCDCCKQVHFIGLEWLCFHCDWTKITF